MSKYTKTHTYSIYSKKKHLFMFTKAGTSVSNVDTAIASTLSNLSNIEYRTFPDLVSSVTLKRNEQESKNARKLLKDIEKKLKRLDGKVSNAFCEEANDIISEGKRVCGKKRKSKTLADVTGAVVEVVQAYNRTIWAATYHNNESAIIYLGCIDQVYYLTLFVWQHRYSYFYFDLLI